MPCWLPPPLLKLSLTPHNRFWRWRRHRPVVAAISHTPLGGNAGRIVRNPRICRGLEKKEGNKRRVTKRTNKCRQASESRYFVCSQTRSPTFQLALYFQRQFSRNTFQLLLEQSQLKQGLTNRAHKEIITTRGGRGAPNKVDGTPQKQQEKGE